jgi:lipopolysaccharide transport system ATP-binding protein
MTDIAIRVQTLSKCYHIYDAPRDRLKQFVAPRLQRMAGQTPKQYFREFWALKDISFEVEKGETVGIVGLNGSGKSTLLRLICGTLSATAGSVETHGRIAALLELGTGFNPEFTGKENVYINGSILGLSEDEIDAKYDAIVGFADIGDFINQPVKRYSSGMYVRLAFAVIANVDAEVLVIDEALAVGDVLFSQKCMRFLRDFKKRGVVLFVSHNSAAVVNLCDRAVWLEKGQMQAIGTAKDVCDQYLAKRYQSSIASKKNHGDRNDSGDNSDRLAPPDDQLERYHDMRMAFINNSNLRNDIQVFEFTAVTKCFGNGGATLDYAGLEDLDGKKLSWMVGGEMARIVVKATVLVECNNVIVGFNVKDKLGQVLFAQNTYLDTCLLPVSAKPGDAVEAIFTFRLPILKRGTYAVDVAIANGTPPDVVQLQWVLDAFVMESQTSSVTGGLIGLSFDGIELSNKRPDMANG